jgi:hypothetical protein
MATSTSFIAAASIRKPRPRLPVQTPSSGRVTGRPAWRGHQGTRRRQPLGRFGHARGESARGRACDASRSAAAVAHRPSMRASASSAASSSAVVRRPTDGPRPELTPRRHAARPSASCESRFQFPTRLITAGARALQRADTVARSVGAAARDGSTWLLLVKSSAPDVDGDRGVNSSLNRPSRAVSASSRRRSVSNCWRRSANRCGAALDSEYTLAVTVRCCDRRSARGSPGAAGPCGQQRDRLHPLRQVCRWSTHPPCPTVRAEVAVHQLSDLCARWARVRKLGAAVETLMRRCVHMHDGTIVAQHLAHVCRNTEPVYPVKRLCEAH